MKLVMFDIDGTLTRTDVVEGRCFVQALEDIFDFTGVSDDWSLYPHCTDSGILESIFKERRGSSPSRSELTEFQAGFLSLLSAEAAARPFQPVEGAHEMLRQLTAMSDVAVSLASGAWERSARLKLASAGLAFPQIPGAFADDAHAREDIMRTSQSRSAKVRGCEAFTSVIYVGDGEWDARACRNLGWPCIGIAHDSVKIERLRYEGAREVFPNYEDTGAFLRSIGI
jgi:phosphoglycolate phosphatase-like HAD superfamily hydrolase